MLDFQKNLRSFVASDRASLTVCFAIAFIAWFLTKMNKEYAHEEAYPVAYDIAPNKTFSGPTPKTVHAELRAQGWTFLRLAWSAKDDTLHIDAEDFLQADISTRSALGNSLRLATTDEVEIYTINPEFINLGLVNKEEKKVPVRYVHELPLSPQYKLRDEISFQPDSVIVYGPGDILDTLSTMNTAPLEIASINKDVITSLALKPTNPRLELENPSVEISVPVEQITEKEIVVPIKVIDSLKTGIQIFPDQALIRCTVGLSQFDDIDENDFELVAAPKPGSIDKVFIVTLTRQPNFIESVSFSPKQVEFFLINP